MRVALLRGDSLNPYEMQSYEPLLAEWDLVAFSSYDNSFNLQSMKIPIQRVHAYSELKRFVPARLQRYTEFTVRNILELQVPFVNLAKHLKNFDIIHTADAHYFYSYQAIQAKKRYGSKVVVTQWENIPFSFEQRRGSRQRKHEVLTNTDLFLAITERAKEALMLESVPEQKIRIVPVGIDLARFQPSPRDATLCASLGLASNDRIILYVGRLVRSKGIFELLFAFWKLLHDPSLSEQPLKLVCAGAGHEHLIKPMLRRLGIEDRVLLIGSFTYDQIPQIHNLADVFVLPSLPTYRWREQFGMVLLESMACGKAVVSTCSGSIPEVVGDAGMLVQPYDHLALYQALKQILPDASLQQQLGQKARRRVETHFDCRSVAKKIDAAYRSILS